MSERLRALIPRAPGSPKRAVNSSTLRPAPVSRTLYFAGVSSLGVAALRAYDVAPDGRRFLMIKESAPTEQDGGPAGVVVRLNLAEALQARAK